ncbi:MAG TPA: VWA domain-containing protein [Bryobacteraceae bacterium]|nr:VWA domain-containing protein [Bryobacteraceae bacterium]
MTRRECGLLLAGMAGGGLLRARPQSSQPSGDTPGVIRVDVDLVNILFTVHKKKGGTLVPGLTKDDFTVYEDGKKQTISQFAQESNLPLTLGLLIDISASQVNLIDIERHAANEFFSAVLRPKDEAFLISFGKDTELLQDFTESPRILKAALGALEGDTSGPPMMSRGPVATTPGTIPDIGRPKGTLLYDAVYLAASEKLKSEVGRKAIVLITDGEDQGSYYDRDQAIEAAQRANAMIYSIYYVDHSFYWAAGMGSGGDHGALKKMSEQTGGSVFSVDKKHPLEDVFKQIQAEMRNQYAIGYVPTNTARDGKFRKIEIKVRDKDDVAQARKGYYATRNDAA